MGEKTTRDFTWVRFLLDTLLDVTIVLVLVILFRTFLYAPFQIHGPSMCDTFNVYNDECFNGDGEYVITSRLSTWSIFGWSLTHIQRGDVVIFRPPYGEKGAFFIKRVIGLPGEIVEIKNGLVYVDGVELAEEYLSAENYEHTDPYRSESETYEVPEGEYFVMGDNRLRSSDSRRCFQNSGCGGESSQFLEHDSIEGEVKMVIYPFTHFRFISGVEY